MSAIRHGDETGEHMDDEIFDERMLDIDLRTFRIIAAIDQAGSITGAAALLGYTQPAVSQHLRRSEARLGVPLVQRLGRSSQLTPAGRVVLSVHPGISQGLAFASTQIRDIRSAGTGRLRVWGFPAASSVLAPRVLSRLRAEHPLATITYREADPSRALEAILEGDCHTAIIYRHPFSDFNTSTYSPESAFYPDSVDIRDVFRDPLYVAMPGAAVSGQGAVSIADLADQAWIGPYGEGSIPLFDVARKSGVEPDLAHMTDNAVASLRMVAAGFGISMLSRLDLRDVTVPPGVSVRPLEPSAHRTVAVATGIHHRESPPALSLLRAVRSVRDELWGSRSS
ncbi:LysR family transcriptional regulator [Microbacterium natoriense]